MEPSDHRNLFSTEQVCPTTIWLSSLAAAGRSPRTIQSYDAAVGKLRAWRSGSGPAPLETLTRIEAMAFVRHLTETYTPGGVAVRVRALRAGWSWMTAEELVEANVFARMKISVPETPQRTAGADEIDAMLAHAKGNRRDTAILAVLIDTGARRGEIANLEVGDVDITSGMLTIRISKTRARRVPLSDRAVVAVGRWLRARGTGGGSLWSSSDPYTLLNAVVLRHSKGQLRCHALRRAFAVRWLEHGGSEVGLCRIAGWSSLTMVRKYTAARADSLASTEMKRLFA